jgi:outer membrane biosynthesis protein TonB
MSYHLGPLDPDQRAELFSDPREDTPERRPRRMFATALALLVMGLFGSGLWFAYVQGTRHAGGESVGGEVPLIRADERPTKVKPERPGGMEIPDRDKLIYNPPRPVVEHLLLPPEKPMPRPAPPPVTQAEAPPPAAAAPPAVSGPPTNAPAPAPAPAGRTQQQAASPGKTGQANSAAAKPAAVPSSAKGGGTRLQLGSVHGEDAARQEWERIKRRNADLIGNLAATPIRADLGDKGIYYRILTEPVADPATAERICSDLKQRSIGCIIAR